MHNATNSLSELYESAWNQLLRARSDRKHPFAFPVFASCTPTPHPRSRTLVLRGADKVTGQLRCFTDRRTRKATEVTANDAWASWTFWNPRANLQVTATGPTGWLSDRGGADIFRSLPKHSRKSYATLQPPGTLSDEPTTGLPADWDDLSLKETDYAAANFGVLVTTIQEMDVLLLHREGHRRMRALRSADGWNLKWLVP